MKPYCEKNFKLVKAIVIYPSEIPEMANDRFQNVKSMKPRKILPTDADSVRDDLFRCIKPFLLFGKIIGLVPISGIFRGKLDKLQYSKYSLSGIITMVIIAILTTNTGIALAGYFRSGGRDATELAKNGAGFVCYMMGLYVFVFISWNSQLIIDLLHEWRKSKTHYGKVDTSLGFKINLIAGIILTSAVAENAMSHLLLFPFTGQSVVAENITNHKLEYYYKKSHPKWAEIIPYHPGLAIVVFICNKWAVYAWNFGDIMIAICSTAIYGRFKGFYEDAQAKLIITPSSFDSNVKQIEFRINEKLGSLSPSKDFEKPAWIQAIIDHEELCRLHEAFSEMLSPLVMSSYVVNIYFICIQLNLFLVPSQGQDFIAGFYGGWSFIHLILRTYIVTITAAKINDYAHLFGKLLHKCPHSLYRIEVERADRKLNSTTIALNGLGTFHINRGFILSVLSVIFTIEIVFLQTSTPLMQQIEESYKNWSQVLPSTPFKN